MKMKLFLFIVSLIVSVSCLATTKLCPRATQTNDPAFCDSFRAAAICHCTASGLPSGMCKDIRVIYTRMISIFGSTQRACEYQHDTSTQACLDDWICYRQGNVDSQGNVCSSTGKACDAF